MSVPLAAVNRSDGPKSEKQGRPDDVELSSFKPVASVGLPLILAPRILAAAEAAAVLLSAVIVKTVYLDIVLQSEPPLLRYLLIALCMASVIYVVYKQMGLYDIDKLAAPEIGFGKVVGGMLVALLIVLGLLYALKEVGDLSRVWFFATMALTVALVIPIRLEVSRWVKRGMATGLLVQRIAIIGVTDFALSLASRMQEVEGRSGAIDLYHCQPGAKDIRFVGGLKDLEAAMEARPYDRVVVAVPGDEIEIIRTVVRSLGAYTTDLLLCTDLTEMPVTTSGARQLAGIRADVVHLVPQSERSALLKTALDVTIAATALILLSPLFLLVALAIKLDSSGPVFFRQRRLGQNSAVFSIYKFRSMTVAEDGPVIVQVTRKDQRVTRVGRFLRATSIDELPQLINVLLGQMSLVGPRPHAVAHDQEFDQKFDLFSRRRRVKPGITGWAQVNGYRGETQSPEDVQGRMEHDLYYIDHWSIWFDLEILTRTLFVIMRGAY